jgi:hypothetical protein
VTFARALRADVVAMVAALLLLFVMATDWYSNAVGDKAREIEKLSQPTGGAAANETQRDNRDAAKFVAQSEEKNAWQLSGAIDRIILVGLLATMILAIAAAWLRAAGRRFEPPATPSTATAVTATVTALLVVYRIIQEPGIDDTTVVKAGPPLALIVLAVIALASREAMRRESDGSAWETPGA